MRKKFLYWFLPVLCLCAVGMQKASAQYSYEYSLGGKVGAPWGAITGKYFMGDQSALEGLLTLGGFGLGVTALYEYHMYFTGAPGWRWYFGGGAHFATGRENHYNPYADGYYSSLLVGLDGVIGIEYKFETLPISVGVDAIPLININHGLSGWWNAGIAVRYTFD